MGGQVQAASAMLATGRTIRTCYDAVRTFVWFIRRVPKPFTCSIAVTAQNAISPKPCGVSKTIASEFRPYRADQQHPPHLPPAVLSLGKLVGVAAALYLGYHKLTSVASSMEATCCQA